MKHRYILLIFFIHSWAAATFDTIVKIMQPYLPANPIIVEAGAHKGFDTVKMKQFWPQSTIYAFEPVPDLFQDLKNNCKSMTGIILSDYALSHKNGYATLHISKGRGDGSSSLLAPKKHLDLFPDVTFKQKIKVQTITLDSWAEQENVDSIDLLWLDLQGYEYSVLAASPNILKTVKVIFTEINFEEAYENCVLYPLLKYWLIKQGFVEKHRIILHPSFGDALFVRADLAKDE